MLDAVLGCGSVLVSLAIALAVLRLNHDRPLDGRGMVGLAASVVHLLLSLLIPALVWLALRPDRPVVFVASVLIFYWVSLIFLVMAIIRWLRAGTKPAAASPTEKDSRQNTL